MITYIFTSNNFKGQIVNIQYSKYDSTNRINLGSGTFPFEYTTDQKGGTYFFYIPSVDRTFPKTIDIPPIDIYTQEIFVPECDLSGLTIFVPSCDISATTVFVPVCDIEYDIEVVTSTPTPTTSVVCPSISGITVGPIEISGGEYTLADNPTSLYLYQFNTSNLFIANIPPFTNSILPDDLFQDEIMVLIPSPYWIDGPCQYCFNINTGEQVPCGQVIPSQTPTPSVTNTQTPTNTSTPTITPSATTTSTPTITPTITPSATTTSTPTITPSITPSATTTITPTNTNTPAITPSATTTPTTTSTPTNTQSVTPSPLCSCFTFTNTGATSVNYGGKFCNGGSFINAQPILAGETLTGCFQNINSTENLNVVRGGECSGGICPTPTPTPTNTQTPTLTPTGKN